MTESGPPVSRRSLLYAAATDFFFLQNRRYPRPAALEWVGNRYRLTHAERQLLHRGVFGQAQALTRRGKQVRGSQWTEELLVVDGHNVQITVESGLLGRPLLLANDGAMRDVAGQSAGFRLTEASRLVQEMVVRLLARFRPREVLLLFDAPMSRSGVLAGEYRRQLKSVGLAGDARAVPVPEREFPYESCVLASSDQAVLDRAAQWLDLARQVIELHELARPAFDFSRYRLVAAAPAPKPIETYLGEPPA